MGCSLIHQRSVWHGLFEVYAFLLCSKDTQTHSLRASLILTGEAENRRSGLTPAFFSMQPASPSLLCHHPRAALPHHATLHLHPSSPVCKPRCFTCSPSPLDSFSATLSSPLPVSSSADHSPPPPCIQETTLNFPCEERRISPPTTAELLFANEIHH